MDFKRVSSGMNVAYDYSKNNLTITIELTFIPFDIRDYKDAFTSPDSENSDNLKWLYCTIYNYIPVAIIHNTKPGLYGNIEDGDWEEIYQDDLWENSQVEIKTSEWELGSLAIEDGTQNLYIDNLRQLADDNITPNDEWYNTIMGKTFSFTHALNANMEFSHLHPETYHGFTPLVLDTLHNAETYNKYGVWVHNGLDASMRNCKVIIKTTINNVSDNEEHTYAVVSADPSTSKIFTEFIYIKKETHVDVDTIQYLDDTFSIKGADNKIIASITQVNDKRVRIKLSKNQSHWKTLTPQIRFKVKHITS